MRSSSKQKLNVVDIHSPFIVVNRYHWNCLIWCIVSAIHHPSTSSVIHTTLLRSQQVTMVGKTPWSQTIHGVITVIATPKMCSSRWREGRWNTSDVRPTRWWVPPTTSPLRCCWSQVRLSVLRERFKSWKLTTKLVLKSKGPWLPNMWAIVGWVDQNQKSIVL